jgi:DNA-binding response OmpR family regulator
MNILIIDDEHELLEKLKSVLTGEHYNVETSDDGRKGLEPLSGKSAINSVQRWAERSDRK